MKKIQKEDLSLSAAWIGTCSLVFFGVLFFAYWFGYSINNNPTEMNIRLHPISLIALTVIPVVAIIGGVLLINGTIYRIAIILLITLAVSFIFLLLSSMYINKVEITSESITETTGTYFNSSTNQFQLTDIQSMTVDWYRNGRNSHRFWIIELQDGKQQEIHPSPAWEYNEAEIVQKIQQFGVTVYRN